MEKFIIYGGKPLNGDITVSGSKNATLGILPAVLLAENPCIIENVPDILDVKIIVDMLTALGAKCAWMSKNVIKIDPRNVKSHKAISESISTLRGSYYFIGALLGRFGKAEVSLPGGCNLGPRPIDLHLKGFNALGADTVEEYGMVKTNAKKGLKGTSIYLDGVTVGATINLMLAASRAEGNTIIENCAREPHVVDVANFLNAMGANIKGAGTDTIRIKGCKEIKGGITYSIIPDQIEAGTFMVAAAATKGDVTLRNIIPRHQESLTAKLQEMNVGIEEGDDYIRVFHKGRMNGANVKTLPYPGFPTDTQPQITALLSLADGDSVVSEGIWDRFQYVDELKRMGAMIKVEGRTAYITGNRKYKGTFVKCTDLRAGAALVIAALASEGRSDVYNIKYIDRGYDGFEKKLAQLGADIHRVKAEEFPI